MIGIWAAFLLALWFVFLVISSLLANIFYKVASVKILAPINTYVCMCVCVFAYMYMFMHVYACV